MTRLRIGKRQARGSALKGEFTDQTAPLWLNLDRLADALPRG